MSGGASAQRRPSPGASGGLALGGPTKMARNPLSHAESAAVREEWKRLVRHWCTTSDPRMLFSSAPGLRRGGAEAPTLIIVY